MADGDERKKIFGNYNVFVAVVNQRLMNGW